METSHGKWLTLGLQCPSVHRGVARAACIHCGVSVEILAPPTPNLVYAKRNEIREGCIFVIPYSAVKVCDFIICDACTKAFALRVDIQ